MDLITQGVLGAAVGQVGFQKNLGKRAIFFGFIIGLLPDADILIAKMSSNLMATELIHRGITHSLFFAFIMAIPLGFCLYSMSRWCLQQRGGCYNNEELKTYSLLCFWVLITHPILDLFTSYGTQLLSPFLSYRFTLSAIPIIDPIYTVPLIISVVIGLCYPRKSFIIGSSLLFLTTCYLFLGIAQHNAAVAVARKFCSENNINSTRIEAFPLEPTLFAQRLWVQTKDKVYITEYSTWTKENKPWISYPTTKVPTHLAAQEEFKVFLWFTDGIIVSIPETSHGSCLVDSRIGSLSYRPLGLFNICMNDQGIIKKNVDYTDAELIESKEKPINLISSKQSFGENLSSYWNIMKNLCIWTFAHSKP